jgi:hypothetical protein
MATVRNHRTTVMPALVAGERPQPRGIHVLKAKRMKTWMAGTSPAMTKPKALT